MPDKVEYLFIKLSVNMINIPQPDLSPQQFIGAKYEGNLLNFLLEFNKNI